MNPDDPDPLPGGAPQPWETQPPPPAREDGGPQYADGSGVGDLVEGGLNAASGMADLASAAGSAIEGAGSALEAAGGCLDGCSGCSLAILVTLFAAASTAMALLR